MVGCGEWSSRWCSRRAVDRVPADCGYDTACVPEKGAETCTGNTVNFCAAGVAGNVDCISLGFTQCLIGRCVTL